ncbi:MAG: hypothetical protein JNM14_16730 [Ferruginibacter sp.]|nr:hypothetical protein [Ferruginibacter sp.]
MLKLAESSGTVIYESENKLYIAKKPAQWTSTWLFVTGLTAFLLLANGLLQFFYFGSEFQNTQPVALVLLGAGILVALIFWLILNYRKKINARPVSEMKWLCIIDLAGNNLLDGQQNLLAPLHQVELLRKMQFSSSSPQLVLKWGKQVLSLVEGNPFAGGIAAVERALALKGIKRS